MPPPRPTPFGGSSTPRPDSCRRRRRSIARCDVLARAQRPLIVLGKGAAYAQADSVIREFVETTGIPFLPMSMAKGLLPDSHPQSAAAARSLAIARADAVLLVGARLNWLLGHGESPQWSADAKFVQVDIAASGVRQQPADRRAAGRRHRLGDVGAVATAWPTHPIAVPAEWTDELADRRARNDAKMRQRLAENPHPMRFYNALGAIRAVLQENPDVYVVNEGANALDLARNVIDMELPRHRLDTGTWGVMGIGMGYAIAAAVETGKPVVAIEGDSAFGFSGMEIETICRYRLPVTVVILNNGGVYRGDEQPTGSDPAPTVLNARARHELIAEAFGGKGYHVTTPSELQAALTEALASNGPSIIDCELDPAAGVESGHLAEPQPDQRGRPHRPPSAPARDPQQLRVEELVERQLLRGCARAPGQSAIPAPRSWWPARSRLSASGSTISTARISPPSGDVHSQVCGTMHAQLPVATCANSEATESVSTCGVTVMPWPAKASSMIWRSRISAVSNASGNCAASGHDSVDAPEGNMSADDSST